MRVHRLAVGRALEFGADLKLGARRLAGSPGFTLSALAVIGLGIGVDNMMFTVYNAALIKRLPFADSERLVHVHSRSGREGWDERGHLYEDYLEFRRRATTVQGLAAYMDAGFLISDTAGVPQRVDGCLVTPNLFPLLAQPPLLGRHFEDRDALPGVAPVVMLGHDFWQSRFGGDPSVLGRSVRLGLQPHTVVGVMPPGLRFPQRASLWVPAVDTAENRRSWHLRHGFFLLGRLAPGASRELLAAELRAIASEFAADRPRWLAGTEPVVLEYAQWGLKARGELMARVALGAAILVLLIACTTVANLLLARTASRVREAAVRIALGATRRRVAAGLLTESVLLSLLGGALGLAVAAILVDGLVATLQPLGVPWWIDWSMDRVSLVALTVTSVAAGVIFGLVPAIRVSRSDVARGLREGGWTASEGKRGHSVADALVVAQISITLVLMVAAGLLVRSLVRMQGVNLGVEPRGLLLATVSLAEDEYAAAAARTRFAARLLETLHSDPRMASATLASQVPAGGSDLRAFDVDGQEGAGEELGRVAVTIVAGGYFDALGLRMVRGREFADGDADAVIVNERFAARHWPGQDPIGKRVRLGRGEWRVVVGVSPPIRQTGLRGEVEALVYLPFRQFPPFSFAVLARSRSNEEPAAEALRIAARQIDPLLPALEVRSFDEHVLRLTLEARILSRLFVMFAAIGLLLSVFGVYSVTAYAVSRRTREIGIRTALGATRADILRLVLGPALRLLGLALALGLGPAFGASVLLSSVLFEVKPLDPLTFVALPVLLAAAVVSACLVPALKAAGQRPVDALRVG